MSLKLYGHPFSSYTQKVLIALYENNIPHEFCCIGNDKPEHSTEWMRRWPLRKFPMLVDGEHHIVESSIIIEYLQLNYICPIRLLPADCAAAPSLFYADWILEIPEKFPLLRGYHSRLLAHPSFARAVEEARPFRHYFPLGAPDRD